MADCQITCINLSHSGRSHEHITHVGNGHSWRWPVADVVESIRNKTNSFFVMDAQGRRANVGVVEGARPYLRTYADGVWTDNLLAQTSCPL
jgi:hypothetical protein